MATCWRGSIAVDDVHQVDDIRISSSEDGSAQVLPGATLRFLSVVETARIPLFLACGRPLKVTTGQDDTERWFSSILLSHSNENDQQAWWQSARTDSQLGILVAVHHPANTAKPGDNGHGPTELLFYASHDSAPTSTRPPTPPQSSPTSGGHVDDISLPIRVHALPLFSAVLKNAAPNEPTPPESPALEPQDNVPTFLPQSAAQDNDYGEAVNLPPVRKRKTVTDTFDEAAQRRQKARRKGGEGVAAAAASRTTSNDNIPSLKHRRSISNSQALPMSNRPLSRASSISSVRPPTVRETSVPAQSKRSALARMQSASNVPNIDEEPTIDEKNKEIISKVVMAGMRLYGYVQSKTRKSRANAAAASPAIDVTFDDLENDRKKDEEYKLVYHQAYKGTCFALRQHIATASLQPHAEALRETVDKLLAIFCSDPLAVEVGAPVGEYTPGGRKAFGSSAIAPEKNPFLVAAGSAPASKANTPCGQQQNERDRLPSG